MSTNHLLRRCPRSVTNRKLFSTLVRDGVEIRCCGALYKSWGHLKPHLPKPKKPELRLRLEYLRTPSQHGNLTVLAFHGSPGNAEHFRMLGDIMHEKCGADFIVPSFPDVTLTLRTGEYFHSAEEKVEMVEAMLQRLGVSEVDLVIAHSAGSYAALLMTLNQKKIRVRSIALICSTTPVLIPAYHPPWLHSPLVSLIHVPGLRKLVIPSYKMVAFGWGLRKMSAIETATSVMSVYATRHWLPDRAPKWVEDLRNRDIPRMVMYSSKDFVIPTKLSEHLASEFGNADPINYFVYKGKTEDDLELVQEPANHDLPPVVHFTDGGHNVMKQFPMTVADRLLQFVGSQVVRTRNTMKANSAR